MWTKTSSLSGTDEKEEKREEEEKRLEREEDEKEEEEETGEAFDDDAVVDVVVVGQLVCDGGTITAKEKHSSALQLLRYFRRTKLSI